MKDEWTREHPEPPSKGSESDWYWYKKDDEKELIVAEVWPGRGWFTDGWWGPIINKPIVPKESKEDESQKNKTTKNEKQASKDATTKTSIRNRKKTK